MTECWHWFLVRWTLATWCEGWSDTGFCKSHLQFLSTWLNCWMNSDWMGIKNLRRIFKMMSKERYSMESVKYLGLGKRKYKRFSHSWSDLESTVKQSNELSQVVNHTIFNECSIQFTYLIIINIHICYWTVRSHTISYIIQFHSHSVRIKIQKILKFKL